MWEWVRVLYINTSHVKYDCKNCKTARIIPEPSPGELTIAPIIATLLLVMTVMLLVLFRHSPCLVATTIACCLVFVATYLIFFAINDTPVETFE